MQTVKMKFLLLHMYSRPINTYQRRRKSSQSNSNLTENQRHSFVGSRQLPDSLIQDPVTIKPGKKDMFSYLTICKFQFPLRNFTKLIPAYIIIF